MAFVKIQKTKAYYKRYQTKYRRRREGKTDYYARKRLVTNDKNKYNSPRYRFVPRITCSRVICQVIYATLAGDRVLCSADSKELRAFGLKAGLTNYSAAYCTGLLCARRLLKQLGMDKYYPPVQKATGDDKETAENPERRPFKAVLDVGLVRTTTGNRVFGALKGALDGGLLINHSSKRFPGYTKDKYDAKAHRDRIFGVHVDKYMKELKKNGEEDYIKQFKDWDQCLKDNKVDSCEKLYTKVHEEIKNKPDRVKRGAKQNPKREHKKFHQRKLNVAARKERVAQKFKIALQQQK